MPRKTSGLPDPQRERQRQLDEAGVRVDRQHRDIVQRLLALHARHIIPREAIEAAREGRPKAEVLGLLKTPPTGKIREALQSIAETGWQAGLTESGRQLAELQLPGLASIVRKHWRRSRKSDLERFDDISERELRELRRAESARAIAERRRLPSFAFRPDGRDQTMIRREADRFAHGLRRLVHGLLTGEKVDARDRKVLQTDNPEQLGQVMEILRDHGPGSDELYKAVKLERSATTAAAAEVDWSTFQRAHVSRSAADKAIKGFQWVNAQDDDVTCVCEIFGGQMIAANDPRVMHYAPRIHYNCRCAFFPRAITDRALITWDDVQTFSVVDRDGRRRSITAAPGQFKIPQNKPNQAPPARCTDWLDRSRTPPPQARPKSQEQLERDFVRQRMRQRDRQVAAILQDGDLEAFSEPSGCSGGACTHAHP